MTEFDLLRDLSTLFIVVSPHPVASACGVAEHSTTAFHSKTDFRDFSCHLIDFLPQIMLHLKNNKVKSGCEKK